MAREEEEEEERRRGYGELFAAFYFVLFYLFQWGLWGWVLGVFLFFSFTSTKLRVAFLSVGSARSPTKQFASIVRFSYLTSRVGKCIPTLHTKQRNPTNKSHKTPVHRASSSSS
jgi:hypothetical protein